MKLMDRQTLSIMKACEAVGVSRRTIYNWISAGKVEDVRTAGGSIRIFADSLWRGVHSPPSGTNVAQCATKRDTAGNGGFSGATNPQRKPQPRASMSDLRFA